MMPLSLFAIKNAKPKAKPYKLTDFESLYLLVKPNGSKLWQMGYSYLGRQKTMSFGPFPRTSLAEARQKKDEAKKHLANGLDPSEQKKLEQLHKVLSAENTFKAVAEEWYEKRVKEGLSDVTLSKIRWLLNMSYPSLANRPIAKISAQELLLVLRKVEANGRYETARRMRSVFGRVFRYAIATARAERDIASDLRGALITPKVKHLAAITEADAAGELLRAIEGYKGHEVTRFALRLSPHVFARPGELRKAEWSELDMTKAIWSVPAEKMKMRFPHKVPLSTQALTTIEELRPLTGDHAYLFPSLRTWKRPMSENAVNGALRRLGFGPDEMTAHGFRAMAATLLNEMGIWNPDAIERQLAHQDANSVRRAYSRGEFWQERVKMMQHWSNYLDQLRDGAKILTGTFGAR